MSVVIIESSGNSLFDDSAERAVRKASPLPVPKDPGVFKQFRSFSLEFAPDK
ncbi:protein containing TonB, C-terminal domains [methanotrophic bacterial endosymbiont of Bathymodiolus sp.]|nr:protein containing TonB, C-terminal domains [methanotrophic bacterial endosymbiont of Bathymodiolus sp.]